MDFPNMGAGGCPVQQVRDEKRRNSCPALGRNSLAIDSSPGPQRATSLSIFPTSTSAMPTRKVQFDTVEVHEHEYILGCNALAHGDVLLTLSWHATSTNIMSVDKFEAAKLTMPRSETKHPNVERWDLLNQMGFDHADILEAKAYCESIRKEQFMAKTQRELSTSNHPVHIIESPTKQVTLPAPTCKFQNSSGNSFVRRMQKRFGMSRPKRAPTFGDGV